jgi:hypothetical protein
MAPRLNTSDIAASAEHRPAFNVDGVAIVLALSLAALIRLNVIHHIGW